MFILLYIFILLYSLSLSLLINEQISPSTDGSRAQAVNDRAEIIIIIIIKKVAFDYYRAVIFFE